ncbi:deoxyuridine 5'-triphosphate nucleotidohydrolase [candidate division WOR-3 bacterium JGI_Cruoil_03_51_56]|uniref:dUTP diphosphatase n=1 Tax=candidate division WOR-3 bacterium JGI_Cruoil_03_51_56 TaxID=1973747 RepID=A0A235BV67_UNCW3|nr:MAG: deoxyuridine 5'-triphosphate nucleotidohydrolase [candidate division WOR-3 bacterium JGI_Cruoil_03_51_56]
MKPITVRIKLLSPVPLPKRQTSGSAGFDLTAAQSTIIKARSFATVSTGLAIELPKEIEAQVRPRSGLAAAHGIGILNSPGTIDPDYRGEIKVILFNCSEKDFPVRQGDRIAQLVFSRAVLVNLQRVEHLSRTQRGTSGFGHTG